MPSVRATKFQTAIELALIIVAVLAGIFSASMQSAHADSTAQPTVTNNNTVGTGNPFALFQDTISGNYVDNQSGFSITFPDGWKGAVLFNKLVMVAPNGLQTGFKNATISIFPLSRAVITESMNSPTSLNSTGGNSQCPQSQAAYTTINGMSAYRITEDCQIHKEYKKSDTVMVITNSDIIVVSYTAYSPAADKTYHDEFTKAISTLKVNNPVDVRSTISQMTAMKTEHHQIKLNNSNVDVTVQSSPNITNFEVSEQQKRISFTVEGQHGTHGTTNVLVSNVLQGPYVVSFDGNTSMPFTVLKDESSGDTFIQISYSHSQHDITITGTQVVPEFPAGVYLLMASVFGAIVFLSRRKSFSSKPPI